MSRSEGKALTDESIIRKELAEMTNVLNQIVISQEIAKKPRSKYFAVYAVNAANGRRVEIANTRKTTQEAAQRWADDNAPHLRWWQESESTASLLCTPKIIEAV